MLIISKTLIDKSLEYVYFDILPIHVYVALI